MVKAPNNMVASIFHQGSGCGNQLHRYVGSRCLALDRGEEHGMVAPELFKGSSFLNLDMGTPLGLEYHIEYPSGKVVIEDCPSTVTIVDGEFQDEDCWKHHESEVREWLKVEPLEVEDNMCVIGFRGGEYQYFPELFLPLDYWNHAIRNMQKVNQFMRFRVVTDDPELARIFFPQFPISHEIGHDWRSIRYAKYAIIANSSFYIFPVWLNKGINVIAPLHWARHNEGYWSLSENLYKRFTYQDKEGKLHKGSKL